MPDGTSLLTALPIGLLLFIGTYAGIRLRRAGRNRARLDYPRLAERLGLELIPPTDAAGVGKLRGTFRGRKVVVDPDETSRISIAFSTEHPIDCRSYEVNRRPKTGLVRARTGIDAFDRLFTYPYVDPRLLESLLESREALRAALAPFRARRGSHLRDFVVKSEGIDCTFDFGKPPHIPARVVEEVLFEATVLADLVESASERIERAS